MVDVMTELSVSQIGQPSDIAAEESDGYASNLYPHTKKKNRSAFSQ